MRILVLALLASFAVAAQQTVTKPGTTAPYAQNVQGCSGCTALGVTGAGTFDVSDRVGRALGVVTIGAGVAAIGSITNTSFGATQGTSPWVTADNHTTAAAPLSLRLSDGAAFYDARQIRALTVADVVGLGAGSAVIGHVINDASSAVIGHVIHDSGSTTVVTGNVTVVQPTGTNLHAVLDTTSTTAVTQATGTNLHAVLDTTSTTAVTQATPANLQATVTGAVVGHGTAATAMRVELPTDGTGTVGLIAGSAIVGKVGIDQTTPGTTNAVQDAATSATGSAVSAKAAFLGGGAAAGAGNLVGATVKAASTASAATDTAVVVAVRDSFSLTANQSVNVAQVSGTNTLTGGSNGSLGVGGLAADGSAVVGNPVLGAGKGFNGIAFSPRYCDKLATVTTLSTTVTVQQIAAVANQKIYICGYYILASTATTAVTLKWTEGTGSNCVTGLANVTPAIFTTPTSAPTTANFTLGPWGNGAIPWMVTAGDALCITQSSGTNATTLSGVIFYTQN